MLSDDSAPPVDRPNLSKDYLAGNAPEEWVPLRADSFYADERDRPPPRRRVAAHHAGSRQAPALTAANFPLDRLLLATGAEPVRLSMPGADQPHVHTLRSLGGLPRHHRARRHAPAARS